MGEGTYHCRRLGVTMIHGISVGYDAFTSPDILWEHFKRVKAQEDDIWVGTFREVAAYVKERNNIQLDVTKKNPIGWSAHVWH